MNFLRSWMHELRSLGDGWVYVAWETESSKILVYHVVHTGSSSRNLVPDMLKTKDKLCTTTDVTAENNAACKLKDTWLWGTSKSMHIQSRVQWHFYFVLLLFVHKRDGRARNLNRKVSVTISHSLSFPSLIILTVPPPIKGLTAYLS